MLRIDSRVPIPFVFAMEILDIFAASLVLSSHKLYQGSANIDRLLGGSIFLITVEVGKTFGRCFKERKAASQLLACSGQIKVNTQPYLSPPCDCAIWVGVV